MTFDAHGLGVEGFDGFDGDVVLGLAPVFDDAAITISPADTFDEYTALLYQGALGRTPDPGGLAGVD